MPVWWCIGVAQAFTLQPVQQLGSGTLLGLAAADDTVVVSWTAGATNDLVVKTSIDRGLTFGAARTAAHVARAPDADHRQSFLDTSAVGLSADGSRVALAGGISRVDLRRPPLFVDPTHILPDIPAETFVAGVWRDDGAGWAPAHLLRVMDDGCSAYGNRCMALTDIGRVVLSDDGDVAWTSYTGWDHYLQPDPGMDRESLVSRTVSGVAVGAPFDLSALALGGGATTAEGPARLATDGPGDTVAAAFYQGSSPPSAVFTVSHDGGFAWSSQSLPGSATDVALARDTGAIHWAVVRTDPTEFAVDVRTSTDGGLTFGAPVTVDHTARTAPGRVLDIDDVALAVSRDGTTLAVAYEDQQCTVACGQPAELVLAVSEDAGVTWSSLGVLQTQYVNGYRLAMAPDGDAIYVAATSDQGGSVLYRATRP